MKRVTEGVNVQNLKSQLFATTVKVKVIWLETALTLQKKEKDQHQLVDAVVKRVIWQLIAQTNQL